MQMDIKAASMTITGVLSGVSSAKKPQDIEIMPTNEEITVTADDGYYIRSVIVKAIPSDSQEENEDGTENTEKP